MGGTVDIPGLLLTPFSVNVLHSGKPGAGVALSSFAFTISFCR